VVSLFYRKRGLAPTPTQQLVDDSW
jgi:hypothetical protein